jgi:hypothetical protein
MPQWLPPWRAARLGIGYSGRPEAEHVSRSQQSMIRYPTFVAAVKDNDVVHPLPQAKTVMKTIVSTLIAFSVLAGVAGAAAAWDAKTF